MSEINVFEREATRLLHGALRANPTTPLELAVIGAGFAMLAVLKKAGTLAEPDPELVDRLEILTAVLAEGSPIVASGLDIVTAAQNALPDRLAGNVRELRPASGGN